MSEQVRTLTDGMWKAIERLTQTHIKPIDISMAIQDLRSAMYEVKRQTGDAGADLLEAAEDALGFVVEINKYGIEDWSGEDGLRAAIAKAKGGGR